MIIRNGQKLGSVLVNSGEDEPKPKETKKKTAAKKTADVKTESTTKQEKDGEPDGTRPPASTADGK